MMVKTEPNDQKPPLNMLNHTPQQSPNMLFNSGTPSSHPGITSPSGRGGRASRGRGGVTRGGKGVGVSPVKRKLGMPNNQPPIKQQFGLKSEPVSCN